MKLTPKEIAAIWFDEVWNQRKLERIHELLAPDAKGHLEGGVEIIGPEAFIEFQRGFFAALPDLRLEILNVLADGDDACLLWQATGTPSHRSTGEPPISFRGTTWFHVEEGRIAEGWDCWNLNSVLELLTPPVAG